MSIKVLREIFQKSVAAVQPQQLIQNEVKVVSGVARKMQGTDANDAATDTHCHLVVRGETFQLPPKCYLVGFGKAVLGMATEMERVLGGRLKRAIVSVPVGIFETHGKVVESRVEFLEGGRNNLPDTDAMDAAIKIKSLIESMSNEDLLIVLISGGGSALLPLPVPPITLEEKCDLIRNLARKGATINELNCVRKKLSLLKGGGLAKLSYPRKTISLILSDIVGDPLDLIASGPTVEDTEPVSAAVDILKKYNLYSEAAKSIRLVLSANESSKSVPFQHVSNFVIGNNTIAAEASRKEAERQGFQSVVVSTKVEGEVHIIANVYARLAREIIRVMKNDLEKHNLEAFVNGQLSKQIHVDSKAKRDLLNLDFNKQICLIFAGETTVIVKGRGKGGRNQQLSLAFTAEIQKLGISADQISFLSCGTDGIDGPTDAAGAVAPGTDIQIESMQKYLDDNDAYTFFMQWESGNNLVKIGHTGTNVMDIQVMIFKI